MPTSSNNESRDLRPIGPWPARLAKRVALITIGLFYFIFVAFAPLICGRRKGFKGWYWRLVKQACSHLLWLLSIRAIMTTQDKEALATDRDSIIVINHRSHLDGFALMDALPTDKWITFAAKAEFWNNKLLRTGFESAGLVPINRGSGSVALQTLTKAVQVMHPRRSVVLFPEGSRMKTHSLGAFKAGAVLVARETGRKITPIVISNSDHLLPHGAYLPSSGTIRLDVLQSFVCDPAASVDDDVARLRNQMLAAFEQ